MNFQEYVKLMECKTQLFLGSDYTVSVRKVIKNNGTEYTGIMAKKQGNNICPTLYIDSMYKNDMSGDEVEYAAKKIADELIMAMPDESFSVDDFINYETANDLIVFRLINAESNRSLLLEVPHRRFHNLAVVYYYVVRNDDIEGQAAIMIRNEHMEKWGVKESDLYDKAYENTRKIYPIKIWNMKDIVNELYGRNVIEEDINMFVVSNVEKISGATVMLYLDEMHKLASMVGEKYYILPSSIHEIILIPYDMNMSEKHLLSMVAEVNGTELMKEDILADSIYMYDDSLQEVIWVA